jgi:hypothetical protein
MKIDPNAPAYPYQLGSQSGLTIRAEIAARIMAGLYSYGAIAGTHKGLAENAVQAADALIAALNQEGTT